MWVGRFRAGAGPAPEVLLRGVLGVDSGHTSVFVPKREEIVEATPDQARRAWAHYVRRGEIARGLLNSQISRSWQRCLDRGARAEQQVGRTLKHELNFRVDRARNLIDAAHPYLVALSKATPASPFVAMLADSDAVVLDVLSGGEGDEVFVLRQPGSRLSDHDIGPNGIGTALANDAYAEVIGAEHLDPRFHDFTCQATPLCDPEGAVCGVIALTRRALEVSPRVREVLFCAANGVEVELCRQRVERELERRVLSPADRCAVCDLTRCATFPPLFGRCHDGPFDSQEVSPVVQAVVQLAHRYHAHAARWRELALDAFGAPQAVDMQACIVEVADLMSHAAATRRVKIIASPAQPYPLVFDPRELGRLVFRGFLAALDQVSPHAPAEIVAGVERVSDGAIIRYFGPATEICVRVVDVGASRRFVR